MNTVLLRGFVLSIFSFFLFSCDSGTGVVDQSSTLGTWSRAIVTPDSRTHRSTITLRADTVFIADTFLIDQSGSLTVDSTHSIGIELTPSGDGYFRGIEQHTLNGSDVINQRLRYWYFFVEQDSLYFYSGMRFRGPNGSLEGSWNTSIADSEFLGETLTYSFDVSNVTIKRESFAGKTEKNYSYRTSKDSLIIDGGDLPFFGFRRELVPGLALYITLHATEGYGRVD